MYLLYGHTEFPPIKYPQCLFNFEGLKCCTYWKVALKRGMHLFQSKREYSHGILKLFSFRFQITINNFHCDTSAK